VDEGRKRVLGIEDAILASLHMQTPMICSVGRKVGRAPTN
jgi:hypothetical protein